MNRLAQRCLLVGAVACLAACGETPVGTADAGEEVPQSAKVLTRVGPGSIQAHPGDEVDLNALLSQSEVGPIPGATVNWKIVADEAGDSSLADAASETDATGLAQTKLQVASVGDITVKADSPGSTAKNATWRIEVIDVVKHVRILGSTDVIVTDGAVGAVATVNTFVNKQTSLRVRVTAEQGEGDRPVSGEAVRFTFGSLLAGTAFPAQADGVVRTQGDGEASIVLAVGTAPGNYAIHANVANASQVTFNVTVSPGSGTGGNTCTSTAQCPSGLSCVQGTCQDPGDIGGSCGSNDRPCPLGYKCNPTSGLCEPGLGGGCETCPTGFHCDVAANTCVPDEGGCSTTFPCPNGFDCTNGICIPAGGVIDVTGHWYTKHTFNVAEALPSWVRTSGAAVRVIDQTLQGQLGLPGWVNSLISGLLQQYIPDWVYTVVTLLDTMFTVFSHLRTEGEMDLVANGGPSVLAGQEYWTSFVFYLLSQCNGAIAGSIWQPPACARVDIYTTELDQADLAVDVRPFAATLGGPTGGPYTLLVSKREARMRFAGILKYVVDQAMLISTGYPSLEDKACCTGTQVPGPNCAERPDCGPGSGALSHLIDCEGVNELVQGVISIDVTALCETAVTLGGQAIGNALRNVVLSQDVLEFAGQATAKAGATASYAEELGAAGMDALDNRGIFTVNPGDGRWDGKFRIGVAVNGVPGRWRASRNPMPVQ